MNKFAVVTSFLLCATEAQAFGTFHFEATPKCLEMNKSKCAAMMATVSFLEGCNCYNFCGGRWKNCYPGFNGSGDSECSVEDTVLGCTNEDRNQAILESGLVDENPAAEEMEGVEGVQMDSTQVVDEGAVVQVQQPTETNPQVAQQPPGGMIINSVSVQNNSGGTTGNTGSTGFVGSSTIGNTSGNTAGTPTGGNTGSFSGSGPANTASTTTSGTTGSSSGCTGSSSVILSGPCAGAAGSGQPMPPTSNGSFGGTTPNAGTIGTFSGTTGGTSGTPTGGTTGSFSGTPSSGNGIILGSSSIYAQPINSSGNSGTPTSNARSGSSKSVRSSKSKSKKSSKSKSKKGSKSSKEYVLVSAASHQAVGIAAAIVSGLWLAL